MFLDLHAYSARRGCYVLGNSASPHKLARSQALSHIIRLYNPQFNAAACSFGKGKNPDSKYEYDDGDGAMEHEVRPGRRHSRCHSRRHVPYRAVSPTHSVISASQSAVVSLWPGACYRRLCIA
jgi:hypothetical protein